MANPVLIEVSRGPLTESFHRGSLAVSNAAGRRLLSVGDVERPIWTRSALKPFQAIALVASGAADAFGLTEREIALACASHNGEPEHVRLIEDWLDRIACSERDLACGAHPPLYEPAARALAREDRPPRPVHNNCSGKHAGFLTLARHLRAPVAGYVVPDHPVQQAVRRGLALLTDEPDMPVAVDGCSAPNYALPLTALARAAARLCAPASLDPVLADAARRIVAAMRAHPFLVAGTGRFCTEAMERAPEPPIVKTGADGVFVAGLPERGIGIALKIDDGAKRASEAAMRAVVARLRNEPLGPEPVRNWNGIETGEIRPSAEFLAALAPLGVPPRADLC